MLDIHFIRENADIVAAGAAKKRIEVDLDRLIKVDDERKRLKQEIETKRAEQNRRASEIQRIGGGEKSKLLEAMRQLKSGMTASEEKLRGVTEEWQKLMLSVPNVPDVSVPDGQSDAENRDVKIWPA